MSGVRILMSLRDGVFPSKQSPRKTGDCFAILRLRRVSIRSEERDLLNHQLRSGRLATRTCGGAGVTF
jgi:hypothetical protein